MIDMKNIDVCPGTLAPEFTTYSPKCIREVFGGCRIGHILPFAAPRQQSTNYKEMLEKITVISISGVQEKYSLKLNAIKKELELTDRDGEYILKPIPIGLLNLNDVPANEHLTMQLAAQVYKLPVAACALIFFADGIPAYITRRFDVREDGTRSLTEDFAAIAGYTSQHNGKDFKYEGSYEAITRLMDKYIPASIRAKEDFFRLVIFNYLFSNGDAHLKNFSRIDYKADGNAFLSPAYDLLNTRLHIDDGDMALKDGLYDGDHLHPSFATYGFYAFDDFYEFGMRIGLQPVRVKRMLMGFLDKDNLANSLIKRSFLSEKMKVEYYKLFLDKRTRMGRSLLGLV
jgi:serine/threonine-protein kinase HipA